jgi:hypothetical protein
MPHMITLIIEPRNIFRRRLVSGREADQSIFWYKFRMIDITEKRTKNDNNIIDLPA